MDNHDFQAVLLITLTGILIGMGIIALAITIRDSHYNKFCPVCGRVYTNSDTYCADDGTLLKEKLD